VPDLTVQRRANVVVLRLWFSELDWAEMKLRPLESGAWWIDLVRVDRPAHRGRGRGSELLEAGKRYALDELRATNLGLEPEALDESIGFDLAAWYRRHGFVHEHDGALWLRSLEPDTTKPRRWSSGASRRDA